MSVLSYTVLIGNVRDRKLPLAKRFIYHMACVKGAKWNLPFRFDNPPVPAPPNQGVSSCTKIRERLLYPYLSKGQQQTTRTWPIWLVTRVLAVLISSNHRSKAASNLSLLVTSMKCEVNSCAGDNSGVGGVYQDRVCSVYVQGSFQMMEKIKG